MTRLPRSSLLRLGALLCCCSSPRPVRRSNGHPRSLAAPGTAALPCRDGGPGWHTIDLSRSLGVHGFNAILPAHSLVMEDEEAFQSTWWPVVLVGVKTLDAWNTTAAAGGTRSTWSTPADRFALHAVERCLRLR